MKINNESNAQHKMSGVRYQSHVSCRYQIPQTKKGHCSKTYIYRKPLIKEHFPIVLLNYQLTCIETAKAVYNL